MLPYISSGRYGIVSEPVYSSNSVHEINEVNNSLPDSFVDKDQAWPSLPLISEGSFTSLVSKQSGKSLERGRERATKNKEVNSSGQGLDIQRSGLKITQLQLNCQMKNLDRGWCAQGINPRLVNSSRSSQLPTMGFHVMSTAERLIFEQSLGQPVESLHKMKHQAAAQSRKNQIKLGGQTIINKGYRMPVISRVVSPSKPSAPAMPSHAPEANPVNFNSKATSKPISSVAIHSRCCCRHHKQGDDQKATLKSRSSDSLTKERVSRGKKEGCVINQNIHGNTFSGEKRVKPTDRPPPKKLPSPSGFIVGQPRRKSKRVNVLASDSSSSIQEERKRVKKSVPKQMKQKRIKSPEHKSAEILPTLTDPAEESTNELMICVEDARQIPVYEDVSKEPEELMEVECLDEEKESYNREQPDSLDVISVRSATTCDPRRSATPRLLKVASEVKTDPTLAKVFQKLDTDCDGHISFAELKKSLPTHLSSHQIKYLKKIYDMACESTFFGLEEFTATHHMCSLLTNSSPVVSHAMSNLDLSTMEDWLTAFMESFAKSDKQQSGVIDLPSFVKMLASVVNVHPDSFVIQKILDNLGKVNEGPMSAQEDYCVLVDFCQSSDMKKAQGLCRRESCIKVAELVAYFSVLVWRVVGLALFSVHVTDCLFREKHASYRCNNFTLFSHAYELEIAWQASSILNTLIVLAVLVKAFGVQECLSALRNNSKHARFWSLFFQLVGTIISKIVVISTVPPVITILIEVGYVFMVVSTTLVVYFWNGIPAPFKATYIRVPRVIRAARAAYVISLFVFILEYFFLFIITTAQAAFQVTGLHSNSDGNYSTIHILAVVLNFTEASFHYAMVKFFWNKLFDDRKNLLVNDNV